ANGSYTYKSDPNTITANTVNHTDHFVYTIRDGDGDTSTTTLDITVNDVTLAGLSASRVVDEAAIHTILSGLDLGAGLVDGSKSGFSLDETVDGTLVLAAVKANGFIPEIFTTAHGKFLLGADGHYIYTLLSPVASGAIPGANTVTGVETFTFSFLDVNGNS